MFAAGAILFEMVTGRRAFAGRSAVEIFHNIQYAQPPSLSGSPLIASIDRVVHRALAKNPPERYPTADAMANDLRAALPLADSDTAPAVRMMSRLIVLPFRVLRPDPDVDFLAFSLPDAITISLSVLDSLTVRSSLAAARFSEGPLDLRTLASELGVEAAITGTLLHAGKSVRLAVQLIEVPSGTVRWSHTAQVPLDDLFTIQDSVCSAVSALCHLF